jgi:hypothetical protein
VVVQGRPGHAGGGADVVHGHAVVPARGEQPDGDVEDLFTAAAAPYPLLVQRHPASLAARLRAATVPVADITPAPLVDLDDFLG